MPGDWNGLFGLGTNVLLNVIVLDRPCLGVVGLPADTVYGRILPALGIALPLGNIWYAYLARRLARRERRDDVTALPYGPSVPHTFIVVFVVMLPVCLATGDPIAGLAGRTGLGLHHRRHRPARRLLRAVDPQVHAARGDARHAGRHLDHVHLDAPGLPDVTVAVDRLHRVRVHPASAGSAGVRLPFGTPGGLLRSRRHRDRLASDRRLGWSDVLSQRRCPSRSTSRLRPAHPRRRRDHRAQRHRAAAGDGHPARHLQLHRGHEQRREGGRRRRRLRPAPGARSPTASVRSSARSSAPPSRRPSTSAIRAGRPSAVGSATRWRPASSSALVCFTGLVGLFLAVIPIQALVPILLFIGLVIGAQAFTDIARPVRPGDRAGDAAEHRGVGPRPDRQRAGRGRHIAAKVGLDALAGAGVVYHGMAIFGGGAVLAGLMLGAIAVFVIDQQFSRAIASSLIAAGLSFVGLIHGPIRSASSSRPPCVGDLFGGRVRHRSLERRPAQRPRTSGDRHTAGGGCRGSPATRFAPRSGRPIRGSVGRATPEGHGRRTRRASISTRPGSR